MAQLTCQVIGLNERSVSRRMNFESSDALCLTHHNSLEHQDSPHVDNHGCSGDEDGNSSENQSVNTPLYDAGCIEPRAKKRRKQSNPVRYQTTPIMPMLDSEEGEYVAGEREEALGVEFKEERSIKDQEEDYRCPHCSAAFQLESLLQVHIEEEHMQKLLEKQLQQQSYNKSTSGHGREGSSNDTAKTFASTKLSDTIAQPYSGKRATNSPLDTLSQENRDIKNQLMPFPAIPPLIPFSQNNENKSSNLSVPLSMFPGPIPPFLFPVIPQGQNPPISNGGSHPGQGVRIFNLEAYCELCNKEFCNKYFLKTHKANKHGIYSVESIVNSPYSGTFTTSASTGNTFPLPQMVQTSSENHTISRQGLINVDSYCELCQKEFCNKYFLKKHRQKIHGIIDNAQNVSPSHTPATTESKINSPVSVASSSPLTSTATTAAEQMLGSSVQDEPQDLSKIEFPQFYSSQSQKNIPVTNGIMSTAPSMASHLVSVSTSSQEGTCISHIVTGNNPVFTLDKLREMGVINADAFCEICCKEFCNKYFLRTHKINKHGFSPVDTSPSGRSPPQQSSFVSTSCATQSSHTYSFFDKIDENSGHKFTEDTQKQMQCLQKAQFDSEISGELSCEICNRPFSSLYLLKMHKFYTHNIPYIKEEECSKPTSPTEQHPNAEGKECGEVTVKSQMYESTGCNLTDTASQDLQKLQTMIRELNAATSSESAKLLCSLCHLEFENKYFLRAHMMNEHGVLPNEDGHAGSGMEVAMTNIQRSLEGAIDLQKPSTSAPVIDSEAYCEICQKEFCSKYFLKTHKQNIHGIPPDANQASKKSLTGSEEANQIKTTSSSSLTVSVISSLPATPEKPRNVTGRNYCNICNKELCNKYFMKTHMLKMHGINLDSQPNEAARSSTIGGVTCDICQKELCSKYFLKVHKQNTHGIYEEPSPVKDSPSFVAFNNDKEYSTAGSDLNDPTNRYFSNYSEVCPLCDRRFKSVKWLKAHMLNDHTGVLKDSPCPSQLDTSNLDNSQVCMICGQNFPDKVALQVHLIKDHRTTTEELGIVNNSGMNTTDSSTAVVQDQARTNGSTSPGISSSSVQAMQSRLPVKPTGIGGSRIYHCSFCVYSTRWLSNLYAHEKRHTGVNSEGEKRFVCRICHRAYRYNHSLQRHFMNHRAAGFALKDMSHYPFSSPHLQKRSQSFGQQWSSLSSRSKMVTGKSQDQMQHPMKVKRYRCSKCNKKFRTREMCLAHIHNVHSGRKGGMSATKHAKLFRCRLCGFATKIWNVLKLHIKQHQGPTDTTKDVQQDSDASASSPATPSNMQLVPKIFPPAGRLGCPPSVPSSTSSPHLPMTFAMPQNPPAAGSFIMQPFLLAQPESDGTAKNGTFVPSLVYLPVCQKVLHPVTLAFTLTPA